MTLPAAAARAPASIAAGTQRRQLSTVSAARARTQQQTRRRSLLLLSINSAMQLRCVYVVTLQSRLVLTQGGHSWSLEMAVELNYHGVQHT